MVYALKDLLLDASQDSRPLEDYATVWRAIVRCSEDVLQCGRGINIPNFGKITMMKNSHREAPGLKGKLFLLSETFQRNHSAIFKKPGLGLVAPCTDFNFARLCIMTQLDKDAAQQMTATLFSTLGKAIAKGHSVRVTFGRIGVLVAEDHRVHFSFFSDDSDPTQPPQAQQHGRSNNGPAAQTSSVSKAVMDEARRKTSARRTHTASSGTRPPGVVKAAAALKPSSVSDEAPTASKPSVPSTERKSSSSSRGPTAMTIGQRLSSAPVPPLGLTTADHAQGSQQAAAPPPASCPPPRTPSVTEVGSPEVRHLQNGVDVELNIKPTSIFPTFRVVGNEAGYKAIRDSAAHHRTLTIAYNRLEERISKEKEMEQRQRASIVQRMENQEAKQAREQCEKKKKQAEWRDYLMKQAEDLRQRRNEEHHLLFTAPPQGMVTAYPQVGQYERVRGRKGENERVIRESLDEQVKAKERMKQQLRRQELDQDQLLIDWVRLTDQQERNNRLAKKILERESLFREWDMQRQHLKDVQAMGPTKIT